MKKSRFFSTVFFFLILLQPETGLIAALDFTTGCLSLQDSIELTVSLEDLPLEELKELLAAGETSKIRFEAQLFQERRGILSLIGDRMLETKTIVHSIRYDRLGGTFVLHAPSGELFFNSFVSLIRAFRTAHFPFRRGEPGGYYLRARVIFLPRTLFPPFNLLESFFVKNYTRLEWKKLALKREERAL